MWVCGCCAGVLVRFYPSHCFSFRQDYGGCTRREGYSIYQEKQSLGVIDFTLVVRFHSDAAFVSARTITTSKALMFHSFYSFFFLSVLSRRCSSDRPSSFDPLFLSLHHFLFFLFFLDFGRIHMLYKLGSSSL